LKKKKKKYKEGEFVDESAAHQVSSQPQRKSGVGRPSSAYQQKQKSNKTTDAALQKKTIYQTQH